MFIVAFLYVAYVGIVAGVCIVNGVGIFADADVFLASATVAAEIVTAAIVANPIVAIVIVAFVIVSLHCCRCLNC